MEEDSREDIEWVMPGLQGLRKEVHVYTPLFAYMQIICYRIAKIERETNTASRANFYDANTSMR